MILETCSEPLCNDLVRYSHLKMLLLTSELYSGSINVPEPETQGRIKSSRKVSIKGGSGIKINVGRDEL